MNTDSVIREAKIAEIEAMLTDERLDEAVCLSGEYLAQADNAWRVAYNSRSEKAQALLSDVLVFGCAHVDTLFQAGAFAEAYSTAVMLMMVAVMGDGVGSNLREMLALCVIALSAFQQLLATMIADEFTRTHSLPIIRYLGSMCMVYYRATQQDGLTVWHRRAYMHLASLDAAGMIDHDPIEVNGARESAMHPSNIVGDILAHSRALQLIEN